MEKIPFGALCCGEPSDAKPPSLKYSDDQQLNHGWEEVHEGTKTYWKWTEDHDA